jgi:hypothetical protein
MSIDQLSLDPALLSSLEWQVYVYLWPWRPYNLGRKRWNGHLALMTWGVSYSTKQHGMMTVSTSLSSSENELDMIIIIRHDNAPYRLHTTDQDFGLGRQQTSWSFPCRADSDFKVLVIIYKACRTRSALYLVKIYLSEAASECHDDELRKLIIASSGCN